MLVGRMIDGMTWLCLLAGGLRAFVQSQPVLHDVVCSKGHYFPPNCCTMDLVLQSRKLTAVINQTPPSEYEGTLNA